MIGLARGCLVWASFCRPRSTHPQTPMAGARAQPVSPDSGAVLALASGTFSLMANDPSQAVESAPEMMRAFQPPSPYASREIAVDRALHMLGLLAATLGSVVLIWMTVPGGSKWWPIIVYSSCLLAMLSCSAAYNLCGNAVRRPALRRFDHAAIFLMIAGTYTPFTTRMLPESLGFSITASVWGLALLGALLKLLCPHRLERVDLALYLGLGWLILVAWEPLRATVDGGTASLILTGGILYTIGAGFHVARRLRFQNVIWHGFVLVAASCHYAAVLRSLSAI